MKNTISKIKEYIASSRNIESEYLKQMSQIEGMDGLTDSYKKEQVASLTKKRANELWKLYPQIEDAYSELKNQYNEYSSIWKGKDNAGLYQLLQLISFGVQPPKEMYSSFTKDNKSLDIIETVLKKNKLNADDTKELKRMSFDDIVGNSPTNDLYFASRNISKQSENSNIFNTMENRIELLSTEICENGESGISE